MKTKQIDLRVTRMNSETFEYDEVVIDGKTTYDCLRNFINSLFPFAHFDKTSWECDIMEDGNFLYFREFSLSAKQNFHVEWSNV